MTVRRSVCAAALLAMLAGGVLAACDPAPPPQRQEHADALPCDRVRCD